MFILILSVLSLTTPSSLAVKCPLLEVTTSNLNEITSNSNSVYGNFSGVYKLSDVKYSGSGKRVYEQQENQGWVSLIQIWQYFLILVPVLFLQIDVLECRWLVPWHWYWLCKRWVLMTTLIQFGSKEAGNRSFMVAASNFSSVSKSISPLLDLLSILFGFFRLCWRVA